MDIVRRLAEERVDALLLKCRGLFRSEEFLPRKLGGALERRKRGVRPISLQVWLAVGRSGRRPARFRCRLRGRLTGRLSSREGSNGEGNGWNAEESIGHGDIIAHASGLRFRIANRTRRLKSL